MVFLFTLIFTTAFAAGGKFASVTGQCAHEVNADRASLVLTAEVRDASAGVAAKKATGLYEKLRIDIKKMALKDVKLQTTTYTVTAETAWEKNKEVIRGYVARMGLQIETSEISRMGEVMELSAKLGVQKVSDLNTFLSPVLLREELVNCLDEAVKNARFKAEKMAVAGNAKLGEVLRLEEFRSAPSPEPFEGPKAMMMDARGGAAPPQIEARARQIEVTVYVTYALQ